MKKKSYLKLFVLQRQRNLQWCSPEAWNVFFFDELCCSFVVSARPGTANVCRMQLDTAAEKHRRWCCRTMQTHICTGIKRSQQRESISRGTINPALVPVTFSCPLIWIILWSVVILTLWLFAPTSAVIVWCTQAQDTQLPVKKEKS